jgi:hypothetical protein
MTPMLRRAALALLPAIAALPASPAFAQGGDQMGFTTYYFTDSGSNTVATTAFNLAKQILDATVVLIDIELDHVTVPPVTAITGATRPQRRKDETFEKNRGQIIIGAEQGLGMYAKVAGNFYSSSEVDYKSTGAIATFSQEIAGRNATLTFRGQYNADQVGELLEDGQLVEQPKKTYQALASLSQILSPTTVMDLSYDMMYQKGFLSDPYRQVRVYDGQGASTLTDEAHPDYRTRHAGTARLTQFVAPINASVIGSYRYYFDTWDVSSHTAEMKFNKYIFKNLILTLDYRYYNQTGASFYLDRYVGPEYLADAFRTSDYKLKPFSSNNVGFSLTYLLRGLRGSGNDLDFLENAGIEVMYFRYFNSLDFSADILQGTLKFSI